MTEKTKTKLMLIIIMMNALVLAAASEAASQERIDDWYGQEMTELHAQLKYDEKSHGDKFKFKNYGNGKHSLTMTDFRGVKCEYISLDFGYTVKYRVDHYRKKEYEQRVADIKATWRKEYNYYVLKNTVVAMFDSDKNRIGFALLRDLDDDYKNLISDPDNDILTIYK